MRQSREQLVQPNAPLCSVKACKKQIDSWSIELEKGTPVPHKLGDSIHKNELGTKHYVHHLYPQHRKFPGTAASCGSSAFLSFYMSQAQKKGNYPNIRALSLTLRLCSPYLQFDIRDWSLFMT